jgi:Predicted nucleotide-binding protein containing TIR-like domain
MSKPSVFIGSSGEGLAFARAVRSNLQNDAEITLWNEGFFRPGVTFIEGLVNSLPRFDFAVLVFQADDLTSSRGVESFTPRDNVVFELGLFMGRLGRSRTFIVYEESANVKMPSDLAGLTTAPFTPREDGDQRSAVGPACDSIRDVIRDLGTSEAKTAKKVSEIQSQQNEQGKQLARQEAEIRSIRFALEGIVTKYEIKKLEGLIKEEAFLCYYSDDLYNEMKRLRGLSLVQNHDGVGLTDIRRDYKDKDKQFDLRRFFFITDRGREYLKLLTEVGQQETENK